MLYVGAARGGADERGAEAIRRARRIQDGMPRLTLTEFKHMVREQYFMLLIDEEATLAAIPKLLPAENELHRKAFAMLVEVLSARGQIEGEAQRRLQRIAQLFGVEGGPVVVSAQKSEKIGVAKAS
jgi:hypothetical protein